MHNLAGKNTNNINKVHGEIMWRLIDKLFIQLLP